MAMARVWVQVLPGGCPASHNNARAAPTSPGLRPRRAGFAVRPLERRRNASRMGHQDSAASTKAGGQIDLLSSTGEASSVMR